MIIGYHLPPSPSPRVRRFDPGGDLRRPFFGEDELAGMDATLAPHALQHHADADIEERLEDLQERLDGEHLAELFLSEHGGSHGTRSHHTPSPVEHALRHARDHVSPILDWGPEVSAEVADFASGTVWEHKWRATTLALSELRQIRRSLSEFCTFDRSMILRILRYLLQNVRCQDLRGLKFEPWKLGNTTFPDQCWSDREILRGRALLRRWPNGRRSWTSASRTLTAAPRGSGPGTGTRRG